LRFFAHQAILIILAISSICHVSSCHQIEAEELFLRKRRFSNLAPNNIQELLVSLIWFQFQVRYIFSPISILFFRHDNNLSICGNNTCNPTQKEKNNKTELLQIVIPVISAVALLFLAAFVLVIWTRRNNRSGNMIYDTSYTEALLRELACLLGIRLVCLL
jgi:hypothetical protein